MENLKQIRSDKFTYQTAPTGKLVKFELYYYKGQSHKGVLARIAHTTIEQHEGYTTETFEIFSQSAVSLWVKELARKSDKEVVAIAEKIDKVVPLIVAAFQEDPAKGKAALIQAIQ